MENFFHPLYNWFDLNLFIIFTTTHLFILTTRDTEKLIFDGFRTRLKEEEQDHEHLEVEKGKERILLVKCAVIQDHLEINLVFQIQRYSIVYITKMYLYSPCVIYLYVCHEIEDNFCKY